MTSTAQAILDAVYESNILMGFEQELYERDAEELIDCLRKRGFMVVSVTDE